MNERAAHTLQRLQNEVLVGDGAIGTMLYSRGISLESSFEHLNLTRPELVASLAEEYITAGAQVIETNTFGANISKLAALGLADKVAEINLAGAVIARKSAGDHILVAGSVGPLLTEKGSSQERSNSEIEELFYLQCAALAAGGVDYLLLETFTSLKQLSLAVTSAKRTGLPICASFAFLEGGRGSDGCSVESFCSAMTLAGADVVGANCGAGPLELLKVVQRMAAVTDKPISVYANSGFPEYLDGRYVYRATSEYCAIMAHKMIEAGANIVGGCCGTTPEHISAMAAAVTGMMPAQRNKISSFSTNEPETSSQQNQSFLDNWGKRCTVTVELDPPKGLDCSRILAGCARLKDAGAAAINLAENPLARPRMGNIALGNLIQREVGIEVIVHVTGRDRNLIGMQSDMMGAHLLGIRSLLAVTGDPATMGDHAGATSVFDLHSLTLLKLLSDMNNGVNAIGNSIDGRTAFTIGAAFNPNTGNMAVQAERLQKKVANGAAFVQTQPVYDPQLLFAALDATAECRIPFLPGIMPLVSERNAEFLNNEVPGISVPDSVRMQMKGLEKEAGVAKGLEIAREFIDATFSRVGGYYLIPPFGKFELAVDLIEHIRETERKQTCLTY